MTVYLVGAGPGDPGLLTVRARELIARADVILHDRLIPPGALDDARGELIDVGKVGGGEQVPQEETARLLVARGRSADCVVRLKGGDPFVFGRGGEEAQVLREAGIPFEVVPGVTAGVAAPAYAGIPVTHRGLASAVAFVTGHSEDGSFDSAALAAFPGTLVFYMGVRALPAIADGLLGAGRSPEEPAAVVERGTLPGQRVVRAPLREIAARAQEAGVRAPAITVVGADALFSRLRDARVLAGVTVAAIGPGTARALRAHGVEADVVPARAVAEGLVEALADVPVRRALVVSAAEGRDVLPDALRERGA